MIRLFASDLDGTLIRWFDEENGLLADYDLQAIESLKKENIHFLICTSRHTEFFDYFSKDKNLIQFDTIGGAGALIRIDNKLIYEQSFQAKDLLKLHDCLKTTKSNQIVAITSNRAFISDNHKSKRFINLQIDEIDREFGEASPIHLVEYLNTTEDNDIKYCFVNPDFDEDHDEIYEHIKKQCPHLSFISCGPGAIQVMQPNMNKAFALEKVMEHFNIKKEEVAVIGDGTNDIEMFQMFPTSFCMKQATDAVKKHAKYEVSSVKEAIDYIINRNKETQDVE